MRARGQVKDAQADAMTRKITAFLDRCNAAKAEDHYFYLRTISGPTANRVVVDGREMVMLGSYSYLGLISHPRITEAAKLIGYDASNMGHETRMAV